MWELYLEPIPPDERGDLMGAYHRRLTADSRELQRAAAPGRVGGRHHLSAPESRVRREVREGDFATAFARIECHYFVNRGFLRADDSCSRTSDASATSRR